MLLSQYQNITQALIQSPQSPIPLLATQLLTDFINLARQQIAVDGECVRTSGTGTVNGGLASGSIGSIITLPPAAGYAQAIVVRNGTLNGARLDIRPWDWFVAYNMASPRVTPVMSHQGEGSTSDLYFSSIGGGALWLDVVALPIELNTDSDPDVIPYPWSDVVPFYAAWYAYMAFQRQADADMFMMRYREFMRRARGESSSTNLPENDPGGMGAMLASSKMPLGQPPPQPARGRGAG